MMSDSEKMKQCPACKAEFGCNPIYCWCNKLPPVMPMTKDAKCYCPDCLGKLISDKLKDQYVDG